MAAVAPKPPPPQRSSWIAEKIAHLAERPGHWEVVAVVASHDQASPLRQRFKDYGAKSGIEVVARKGRDGVDIWARVVGGAS